MEILVHYIFPLIPSKRAARPFVFLCLGCLKDGKLKLLENHGFSHLLLESELTEEIMLHVWEVKEKRCLYLHWRKWDFLRLGRSVNWCVLIPLAAPWRSVKTYGLLRKARPLSVKVPKHNRDSHALWKQSPCISRICVTSHTGISAVTNVRWRLEQSLSPNTMYDLGMAGRQCKREETDGD